MELEPLDSPDRPKPRVAPSAEGAIGLATLACALWIITVIVQLGREFVGPGMGVFSGDAMGLRAGLAVLWLAAAVGAAVVGYQSLGIIRKSEGRWGGRGEAICAMVLSLGTIAVTAIALAVYGVFLALG